MTTPTVPAAGPTPYRTKHEVAVRQIPCPLRHKADAEAGRDERHQRESVVTARQCCRSDHGYRTPRRNSARREVLDLLTLQRSSVDLAVKVKRARSFFNASPGAQMPAAIRALMCRMSEPQHPPTTRSLGSRFARSAQSTPNCCGSPSSSLVASSSSAWLR